MECLCIQIKFEKIEKIKMDSENNKIDIIKIYFMKEINENYGLWL